jgi:RimJ/RimL family protein N-acetyltransferase
MLATYHIREARLDDAEAIIAHSKAIADEPNNMTTYASAAEFTYTPESERELIQQTLDAPNAQWLVAESAGEIVANCRCLGGKRCYFGTVTLGISVAQAWRGRGVGTAVMQHLIGWASTTPGIHRLDLDVVTTNAHAIHIYEKLGFQREGIRRRAMLKYGQFFDVLTMALLFETSAG